MNTERSLYRIGPLSRDQNAAMLRILNASPIESDGTLIGFERNPNVFALADLKYDNPVYTGFFRKNELMGFGLMGCYQAYVNGRPEPVCHATHFHITPEGRQRGFYYRASRSLFHESLRDARIGYALMMVGNRQAESLVARRHERYPDVPHSKIIARCEAKNILVSWKRREHGRYRIRHASDADIDAVVDLLHRDFATRLFAPCITREEFERNLKRRPDFGIGNYYVAEAADRIVGVCAAWDCSSFKQLRVLRYGRHLKSAKRLFDILSRLRIAPRLPDEHQVFKEAYITDYAVENRDPAIMRALLTRVYNEYRRRHYNLLVFGSCLADPLLKAAHGFLHVSVQSHIVMGSPDRAVMEDGVIDTALPYVDFALL